MAISLVASTSKQEPGGDVTTETTNAIDTTGANLIVVAVFGDGDPSDLEVSDNKSNTYTPLTRSVIAPKFVQLFYVFNPTVGTGHTFTADSGDNIFCSIGVQAFSGGASFDQQSGEEQLGAQTIQPGSLTPPQNGALFVLAVVDAGDSQGHSVNQSFLETLDFTETSNAAGACMAYLIQGTAAAINPTITSTGPALTAVRMATFLASVTATIPPAGWIGQWPTVVME